jgi:hypothetical protein
MRIRILLTIFALIMSASGTNVAVAQEAPAPLPANVVSGTCDAPGEVSFPLAPLAVPGGEQAGATGAISAASAYSLVPASIGDLLAGGFAIQVREPGHGETIACGEIGGTLDANGALTIGIASKNLSGYSGIAYLAPAVGDPAQTGISTFIAQHGVPAAPEEAPSSDVPASGEDATTYPVRVRSQVTLIIGSLQRVDALFTEPEIKDTAWVNQVAAELTLWQLVYADASELSPPPELAEFHVRYLEAIALLDSAALDVFDALETSDQEHLALANEKIASAIQALRELDAPDQSATPAA